MLYPEILSWKKFQTEEQTSCFLLKTYISESAPYSELGKRVFGDTGQMIPNSRVKE